MLKFVFAAMLVFLLSACMHTAPIQPIALPTYVYVDVPPQLTKDCEVTKPPTEEAYISLSMENKEKQLYIYSSSLLGNLSECNIRLRALKNWNIEQKKVYTK